jgi:hypothetical protein
LESEYATPVGQDDLANSMDIEDTKVEIQSNAIVNGGRTEEEAVDDVLGYSEGYPSIYDDDDDESL